MKTTINAIRGGTGDTTAAASARIQDNLYLAINGNWAKTAKIPDDKSRIGGFSDLDTDLEKLLMAKFAEFRQDPSQVQEPLLKEALKLNRLAFDFKQREQLGLKPAQDYLQKLDQIHSWADVNQHLADMITDGLALPLTFSVQPDMKHTAQHLLYLDVPGLILPDKTYYAKDNTNGKQLLAVWSQMAVAILQKFGYDQDQAEQEVTSAKAFDALLVPLVKNSEELADYPKQYNPYKLADVLAMVPELDLHAALNQVFAELPETVILTQPRYFKALSTLLIPEHFAAYRSWLLVNEILGTTGCLTEELRQLGGTYSRAINGAKTAPSQEKHAYRLANGYFDEPIGRYYGQQYFGATARQDVTTMVQKMIGVYKHRLSQNDWLSEATKKKAILKLNTIKIKVGYPDDLPPIYQKLKIDPQLSLLPNVLQLNRLLRLDNFAKLTQPTDRSRWAMPGNLVNACYDPSFNDITFPAAILQAPFYSLKQSNSQNYGGIGAVIAHEISHAFDNNGAKFDEQGNLSNWWTKADYAAFDQRTQAMVQEFDGIPFADKKVNGKLVISENVADAGGLSCALEAAKQDPEVDLTAFFKNWARVWRLKATKAFNQLLLAIDVHAPGPLRANVQAQNMADFYTTFNVTENDGMWLEPQKRVNIW